MEQRDLQKAVQHVAGRAMKIVVQAGTPAAPQSVSAPKPANADEATERALAHPDVRRFQEIFPDAQVRTVRNLKES
jgi:hypothetical protein